MLPRLCDPLINIIASCNITMDSCTMVHVYGFFLLQNIIFCTFYNMFLLSNSALFALPAGSENLHPVYLVIFFSIKS